MSGIAATLQADEQKIRNQLKKWQERLLDLSKSNPLLALNRSRVSRLQIIRPQMQELFQSAVIQETEIRLPMAVQPNGGGEQTHEYEIEPGADGQREPQYVPNPGSEITLEHIIPQKPGKGWDHLTADEMKANTNRLGNLVLLTGTVNSKLGNVAYHDKKTALLASEYSLTKEAGRFSQWGVAEVAKRQDQLADLAVKTWPLA